MRPHGRASISPQSPRALGVCDRCGFLYNHDRLAWQFQWRGAQVMNIRVLVCQTCMDTPQQQLRVVVLPPDPTPIQNPRPEGYDAEVTNYLTTESLSHLVTESSSDPLITEINNIVLDMFVSS